MSRLFLGIDGGQSSTTALMGDETGRVLGAGRAGPCRQPDAIRDSVAAFGHVTFEAVCVGLSGGTDGKEAMIREAVRAEKLLLTHDAMIALAGATGGEPGVLVIAGTGSIAFGRNAEGRTARSGGWGYSFGDEGSAYDLVRQALRAALRAEEGWGPETSLRQLLLQATGTPSANHLMHSFYTDEFPRERIASFANLVDQALAAGDEVAREILGRAAQALYTYTCGVRDQLFERGAPAEIRYSGGVFRSHPLMVRYRVLVELTPGNRLSQPMFGPAAGALLEAYRLAGIQCMLTDVPEEKVEAR